MRQGKWSEEQIIGILKQVEGGCAVAEVCREHGVGESIRPKGTRQVEKQIQRSRSQRGAASQATRRGKRQAQATGG